MAHDIMFEMIDKHKVKAVNMHCNECFYIGDVSNTRNMHIMTKPA